MHVVATAGHVDHGKSTLVRALTGTDPDRLEEERRRGLTIELGYAWTELDGVGEVAFVDVPGHERFITTTLSGVGPVPAVLLVVAADDPWMPQAAEHLAALDALGVRHGVVAVSRADLADPEPTAARARAELAGTTLRDAPVVAVSGTTGEGVDRLRTELVRMVKQLPDPDPTAPVRLWVDRRFSVHGAGTVVTGTLPAGTVHTGDLLAVGSTTVRVRAVQSLGRPVPSATGVARVALNLAGDDLDQVTRGSVLVTPGAWRETSTLDVRLRPVAGAAERPPERPMLHVAATAVAAHCRPLADDLARLRIERDLPLRIGDRALLRDPGSRQVWGVTVLDPAPPPLSRRGAAARRAVSLRTYPAGDLSGEVARRGLVEVDLLRRIGVTVRETGTDGWLISNERVEEAGRRIRSAVAAHEEAAPLDPGLPLSVLAERLDLPSVGLVRAVVPRELEVRSGRVGSARSAGPADGLPDWLQRAVGELRADLEETPFAAPTADRLRELGLDRKAEAAAAKAGLLLRLAPGVVLLPGADRVAVRRLTDLPQPFTTSEARRCLGTSRRVVLPLLDHLDRAGLTRRHADDRREVISRA